MIWTRWRPGHLRSRVGDSSRRSEETVAISSCAIQCQYHCDLPCWDRLFRHSVPISLWFTLLGQTIPPFSANIIVIYLAGTDYSAIQCQYHCDLPCWDRLFRHSVPISLWFTLLGQTIPPFSANIIVIYLAGTSSNQPTTTLPPPPLPSLPFAQNRSFGPEVKTTASRAADPGFDSRLCCGNFSGSSHTSDFKIGTPVATLPGAWCYRVSTGTGWPGVSILWLGRVESLMCNFYLIVAARTLVWQLLSHRGGKNTCLTTSISSWRHEHLFDNFYLIVAARTLVWADLSPRHISMLLGR